VILRRSSVFCPSELAPAVSFGHRSSFASFSDGLIHSSVRRGRSLSMRATRSRCRWLWMARSVPFGKYWRRKPLVFSLLPGHKHHKGMASASSDGSPREPAGSCLPAPSDILELKKRQHSTRGGADGAVHRHGHTRRELHAGGDFREGPEAQGLTRPRSRPPSMSARRRPPRVQGVSCSGQLGCRPRAY
jgi:hypothetical protein